MNTQFNYEAFTFFKDFFGNLSPKNREIYLYLYKYIKTPEPKKKITQRIISKDCKFNNQDFSNYFEYLVNAGYLIDKSNTKNKVNIYFNIDNYLKDHNSLNNKFFKILNNIPMNKIQEIYDTFNCLTKFESRILFYIIKNKILNGNDNLNNVGNFLNSCDIKKRPISFIEKIYKKGFIKEIRKLTVEAKPEFVDIFRF